MGDAGLFRKRQEVPGPSLDDLVNKNAMARLRKDPPGQGAKGKDKIEDTDLIASMAKRLSLLEKDLKGKSRELERVQQDNEHMRAKLHATEQELAARGGAPAAAGPGPSSNSHPAGSDEASHLRSENHRLRHQAAQAWKQVADLKAFLSDHGLVWVGDPEDQRQGSAAGNGAAVAYRAGSSAGDVPALAGASGMPHTPILSPLPPRPPQGDKHDSGVPAPRRRSHTGSGAAGGDGGGARSPSGAAPGPPLGSEESQGSFPGQSDQAAGLPFRMSDLLARVEELNQVAGDGCGQLVPRAGGAVLHTPEPVRLIIFRDGLQLHRGTARPFRDVTSEAILRDVLDGYFPGPLRNDFPEGVPIKVVDRTRESYREALSPVNHPAMRQGGGNVRSWNDLEAGEGAPMSRDGFLAKLPQAIIKNGKVVDVRAGVGRIMGAGGSDSASNSGDNIALVHTPADALLTTSQRNHKGPVLPPPSREAPAGRPPGPQRSLSQGHEGMVAGATGKAPLGGRLSAAADPSTPSQIPGPAITTLQVKSEDGQQTLIIKLQYRDTIGALRKCIDTHRAPQKEVTKGKEYEIRTAFPPRKYDNLSETLQEAGLVPNATLFLRSAVA